MNKTLKFNTLTIHARQKPEETSGAVMPPIFQTSTYAQEAPGVNKGHEYARVTNPTRTALEDLLAGLEDATDCAAFASGLAAMDALLKMLRPGDEVISTNDLYGGSYRLFTQVFEPYGIKFHFINLSDTAELMAHINDNTKMVWIETPTNPLLSIIDIRSITDITRRRDIISVVDNTFASPYLQQPLKLGADVVIHSTTKYLGGHSDIIGGAICTSHRDVIDNMRFQTKASGAIPGPMDCYLTLRGIKTLAVRMQRSCENARDIAHFLRNHPDVAKVFYPGFEDHPGHEIAQQQMRDFGGMVSFSLKNDDVETAKKFMSNTSVFTLAESLGGVESLISHPVSMTHGSIPVEVRRKSGLQDSLIRLSVGIEDIDDLKTDLDNAFKAI
ncbi:MAG: cystathionine gamma-synthase [Balneolales bacterium]|nr:cystathionine gamma-synthase [Balneolales bacterium]